MIYKESQEKIFVYIKTNPGLNTRKIANNLIIPFDTVEKTYDF